MTRYARDTSVSPEQSQEQIKSTLRRYGADSFGVMERRDQAAILFEIDGLGIRINVPLPDRAASEFTETETGRPRKEAAAFAEWERAVRQRWRALLLAIKAKLEAVETGISTLETEFLPFVVCPGGKTVAQLLLPRLEQLVTTGELPDVLALPEKCRKGTQRRSDEGATAVNPESKRAMQQKTEKVNVERRTASRSK